MNPLIKEFAIKSIGKWYSSLSYISKDLASESAYRTFSKVRSPPMKPWQNAFLDTADHQVIKVNDLNHQSYHWEGERETILFLHGWESNSARWKRYVKLLRADGYGIACIDAPAHGRSSGVYFDMRAYASLAYEATKIYKPKFIIGHSAGGYAAMLYLSKLDALSLEHAILLAPTGSIRQILDSYYEIINASSNLKKVFDNHVQKKSGYTIEQLDGEYMIKQIKQAGLIIHDEEDVILPYEKSTKIIQHWPTAKLVTTKGYGHRLQSEEVQNVVLDYIKENS